MATKTNCSVVRRAVAEIWNRLDLELADSLFAPSYINQGGIIPDLVAGPEGVKFAVVLQHTAFPRLSLEERSLTAEGNLVELQWVARHDPVRGGSAPRISVLVAWGTTLILCADGQIAKSWTTWDCGARAAKTSRKMPRRLSANPRRLAG